MSRKLTKLRISEISSVDRAANPGAKVMLMKRDATADTVKKPRGPKPPALTLYEHRAMAEAGSWKGKVKMTKAYRRLTKLMKASQPLRKTQGIEGHLDSRPPMASLEPREVTTEAYDKLWKAAQDYADWNGGTAEAAFAKAYEDPKWRGIVAADKREHFLKATGAALPLPPSSGGPGQRPSYQKRLLDQRTVTEEISKAMKCGLSFEAAATQLLRGKAA